jgi:hypothetical protein
MAMASLMSLSFPVFPGGVFVYLGKGDETFSVGINSHGVEGGVFGDFNGDGKLDLAFPGGVQLGNGDGTFQATIPFTVGPLAGSISEVVGDFNGDGKLDLAITSTGTTMGSSPGPPRQSKSFSARATGHSKRQLSRLGRPGAFWPRGT